MLSYAQPSRLLPREIDADAASVATGGELEQTSTPHLPAGVCEEDLAVLALLFLLDERSRYVVTLDSATSPLSTDAGSRRSSSASRVDAEIMWSESRGTGGGGTFFFGTDLEHFV